MSVEQFEDFYCPYCAASNTLEIDLTGGSNQEFVVDCETCCAPIVVRLRIKGETLVALEIRRENE